MPAVKDGKYAIRPTLALWLLLGVLALVGLGITFGSFYFGYSQGKQEAETDALQQRIEAVEKETRNDEKK